MGITLIRLKTFLVITPISNILFGSKKVVDQKLIEEVPFYNEQSIDAFNLLTQSVEKVKVTQINDHHWYYKNCGTLCKILHTIKE